MPKPGFIPLPSPPEVTVKNSTSVPTDRKIIERIPLYVVTDSDGYILVATTDRHHALSVKRAGEAMVEHEAWIEVEADLPLSVPEAASW